MTGLFGRALGRLYLLYCATLRMRVLMPDGSSPSLDAYPFGPEIFALAERDAVAAGPVLRGRRFTTLAAPGRDGDLATALLVALGCRVVRGATRREGARALGELVQALASTRDPAAIVVDGPVGPPGQAQPGTMALANLTGRAVRAVGAAARWRLVLPATWSGIYVPCPFTTVTLACDEPMTIATGSREEVDDLTAELTRRLTRSRRRAELVAGSPGRLASSAWQRTRRGVVRALTLARDFFLACLAVVVVSPLWWLPWRAAVAVGRAYGSMVCAAWPLARRAGMMNLRRAYGPGVTRDEARRAVWAVFANLGQSVAEGLQFARRFKGGRIGWECLILYEHPQLAQRILKDPRPKIFVTGHLGSWEVAVGVAALRTGRRGGAVVRRIDNPFLNAIVRWVRVGDRSEWIDKQGAASASLERLRRGEHVAILLDENGGHKGAFVDFFGRPASTLKTPAVLSLMTGAPIVLGACVRREGDERFLHRLAIFEPDSARPEPGDAIIDLTARIVKTYEGWIRDDPLQWRWIHWRWKTRPDGTEEVYESQQLADLFAGDHASQLPSRKCS